MVTLSRRTALLGLSTAVALGRASLAIASAATEQRFVVVILRGALDGMAAVVPYGDPAFAGLRPDRPPKPGQPDGLLDLGGFFGLHPALTGLHGQYQAGELLPIHAVAGPYRIRSHFEAQDCLESGADHRMTSGWLNRVVGALPAHPERQEGNAMAIGVSVPLVLRGPATVANWAPHGFAEPQPDLYARIAALNASDKVIGDAMTEGLRARGFSEATLRGEAEASNRFAFPALAAAAGRLLAASDGPRIAALELGGWDTHVAQTARLSGPLRQLDEGLVTLKSNLGNAWKNTVVLAMTEFGRTARLNGTRGTDHGTASVAFVTGGNVAGGRVLTTWPGLGDDKLFEHRDLAPTMDLRSVAKAVLAAQFGLAPPQLGVIFPDSQTADPLTGLLRA
jgi:uncharacterized protein (DUF1501 family)